MSLLSVSQTPPTHPNLEYLQTSSPGSYGLRGSRKCTGSGETGSSAQRVVQQDASHPAFVTFGASPRHPARTHQRKNLVPAGQWCSCWCKDQAAGTDSGTQPVRSRLETPPDPFENPCHKKINRPWERYLVFFGFVKMVPLVGIELTTYRLQGGCSTN